jgi:hypothetical protein
MTERSSTSVLQRVRAELAAASPGPWVGVIKPNGKGTGLVGRKEDRGTGRCIAVINSIPGGPERIANTKLIGNLPTYLTALLDVAEAAEAWIDCTQEYEIYDRARELEAALKQLPQCYAEGES